VPPLTDIALDAMGSDHAPGPEIRGALLACRAFPVRVHLIGPEAQLRAGLGVLGRRVPIEIVHTDEWITMGDKAAKAVREKRNSTMRLGLKMVRERKAAGFVTAGNTGAAMAMPLPTTTGSPCVLLDVGANVDCKVQNLAQFAIMGSMYARSVLMIEKPRVGLLSIGEEESKGNELTREALQVMKQLPIRFIGNVEGRDLYNGHADVIVCDGFVGNVALKTSEGLGRMVREMLRESLMSTVSGRAGALLARRGFKEFKKRFDQSEYGGAPLLGVRGPCIITHGSADDRAILNSIRVAAEFATSGVTDRIEREFSAPTVS
jgi:phosphate acyltransferase